LVILDPLASFDVGEVETDNTAAGKFMAMLQELAEKTGAVVLLVHHTTKGSRKPGADADATNVRGSSALTDNARWVAELKFDGDDALTLAVTKNNNGKPFEEVVYLTRVSAGVLREETPAEAEDRKEQALQRKVSEAVAKAVAKKRFDDKVKVEVEKAAKVEEAAERLKVEEAKVAAIEQPPTKPKNKGRSND
jgi:RecA-family ATPase